MAMCPKHIASRQRTARPSVVTAAAQLVSPAASLAACCTRTRLCGHWWAGQAVMAVVKETTLASPRKGKSKSSCHPSVKHLTRFYLAVGWITEPHYFSQKYRQHFFSPLQVHKDRTLLVVEALRCGKGWWRHLARAFGLHSGQQGLPRTLWPCKSSRWWDWGNPAYTKWHFFGQWKLAQVQWKLGERPRSNIQCTI